MKIPLHIPLRTKLLVSFLMVIASIGIVCTWVGVRLIGVEVIRQTQDKVRVDLNSAREIYQNRLSDINDIVRFTASRLFLKDILNRKRSELFNAELVHIMEDEGLDILTVTDKNGDVIFRTRHPELSGDSQLQCELVRTVLSEVRNVAATVIVSCEELIKEDTLLADRAYIDFIPTPKAKKREGVRETSGMMMKAAAPVLDDFGHLVGVLYGGVLLNRYNDIVDRIKATVYQQEVYKGKDMGTATIFQSDLRISTNVINEDGSRAIGTRVSEEVYDQVLIKGLPWIERAFVVNDWYITAYEPIRNLTGNIIGILYVGVLEKKYVDMKLKTMWTFIVITLVGVLGVFAFSYFLSLNILRPLRYLVAATQKLAVGEFNQKVNIKTKDIIGELGKTYNFMVDSLRERDEKIKKYTRDKIMKSERLATIGQLAAGVAHEINNPLGGILIYSHLLLENLEENDPKRNNLEKIVTQATRCKGIVKGLLDFSRQTEPKMDLANVNAILISSLTLLENQAQFQNVKITKHLNEPPLTVVVDATQIQQVFINIILNAAEAMNGQGDLIITTGMSKDGQFAEIVFTDTGCGISEDDIERLFEPFFTTKEVGQGTGLGLAISYGIVQRHKGTIEVSSKIGKGTTFTIALPIVQEKK